MWIINPLTPILPSGQNRRKSSLWECIFDLSAKLTKTYSFRLFFFCPLGKDPP